MCLHTVGLNEWMSCVLGMLIAAFVSFRHCMHVDLIKDNNTLIRNTRVALAGYIFLINVRLRSE